MGTGFEWLPEVGGCDDSVTIAAFCWCAEAVITGVFWPEACEFSDFVVGTLM